MSNGQGVWTLTTAPLEPNLYRYMFVVDGMSGVVDPANPRVAVGWITRQSIVHVPGPATLPWEVNDVPRGTLHRHFYRSGIVGDQREVIVYTPPGYDPAVREPYPVLYLLHGFGQDAGSWTNVGLAHVILDNLIAQGKAKPMLVVMPSGYGAPELLQTEASGRDLAVVNRNFARFRDTLMDEVMPLVQKTYHAARDRERTAIAGLSMGGAASLFVGFKDIDRFAWIGGFSVGALGAMQDTKIDEFFAGFRDDTDDRLRLLWLACGTDDPHYEPTRRWRRWLDARKVRHIAADTGGAHVWPVWRQHLAAFAPLLFTALQQDP